MRFICLIRGHKWKTRKAHDGVHYRCFRCSASKIVSGTPVPYHDHGDTLEDLRW